MEVVNRRHETDNLAVIDGYDQVVARVRQKLACPAHIDWGVKHLRRNGRKNSRVLRTQNFDFYRH
jgi:hypothetical protein